MNINEQELKREKTERGQTAKLAANSEKDAEKVRCMH